MKAGIPMSCSISVTQLNKDAIIPVLHYFKEHTITDFEVNPVLVSGRVGSYPFKHTFIITAMIILIKEKNLYRNLIAYTIDVR